MSENIDGIRDFIDNEIGYIVLITDVKDGDNNDIWIYASIPPSKYESFLAAESSGSYNVLDFGVVLEMGEGKVPSQEIIDKMKKDYGTDDGFEKTYKTAVKNISRNVF